MAGVTGAGAVGVLLFGLIIILYLPVRNSQNRDIEYILVLLGIHVILLFKFLRFVLRERGWAFMAQSFVTE